MKTGQGSSLQDTQSQHGSDFEVAWQQCIASMQSGCLICQLATGNAVNIMYKQEALWWD